MKTGAIINYLDLCQEERGRTVQKGMNFAIQKTYSVVLMSTQKNAPYNDQIFDDGVIEYEGHDVPANINTANKDDKTYLSIFFIFTPFYFKYFMKMGGK